MEKGLLPGAGSIVAAVEAAAGCTPMVSIGKPGPLLLEVAARAVGRSVEEAVMIGDSLVTDLPAARSVGARSILMLTGVTGRAQVAALPLADRPTEIASDAGELASAFNTFADKLQAMESARTHGKSSNGTREGMKTPDGGKR